MAHPAISDHRTILSPVKLRTFLLVKYYRLSNETQDDVYND